MFQHERPHLLGRNGASERGPDEPRDFATELPHLPGADSAWLCQYAADHAATPSSTSDALAWSLVGKPSRLPASGVDEVSAMVKALAVFPPDVACTFDFGPRWLVVYRAGEDTFGVTIDDYGCHEARLTDDPFHVAPGHSDNPRLVRGSLSPPKGVIEELKSAAGIA